MSGQIQRVVAGRILEGFAKDGTPILHENAALMIRDGKVLAIGPVAEMRAAHPGAAEIGGPDTFVIPGLVNAHHHVGLTPLQLGSPDHPLELWFASRLALRDVDPYLDTLYSAFEMIASGVTTVQHLHSRAPGTAEQIVGTAGRVIDAYRDIGLRASYSMGLRDQNRLVYADDEEFAASVPPDVQPSLRDYFKRFTLPLDDQRAVYEALRAKAGGRIAVQLAPANLHWLSDRALELAAEFSKRDNTPMHIHLVETVYQKAYAKKRTGGTALEYLHRMGLTGPLLTAGHSTWMTESDIELCAHTGTRICHNCSSNLRLKSGMAPLNRFLAKGIRVGLGMDEAGINDDRDMLQEMRLALRVHREPGLDAPHPEPAQILRMATEFGAETTPFGTSIGRLNPGCEADLVMFDWDAVTYPYQNDAIAPIDVLVQRARGNAVKHVMIAGETVYKDGRFARLDRDAVLAEIAARMKAPLTPAELDRVTLAKSVFPYVKKFYDGYLDGIGMDPHYRLSGRD
jgi:cytosine/adenosine deaminase-related metal-dependent hydrolase